MLIEEYTGPVILSRSKPLVSRPRDLSMVLK